MSLLDKILDSRGIRGESREIFLNPRYESLADPFLLPDMLEAVKRLKLAFEANEKITIYGDYDIDGLSAATLLLEGFQSFGYKNVDVFIPNRFVEGYGLSKQAITDISKNGAKLIVTVDCGSLSHEEIAHANSLGVDVIVTDHHGVKEMQPPAVAVINPKRADSKYPFDDLAGVGVAFKLIQAMQKEFAGVMPIGQEKWLLDLVALGTVCDIVSLTSENRTMVFWGLQVLRRTRRIGIQELAKVAGVDLSKASAQDLGFGLGPRMNASGRIDTALHALNLLTAKNKIDAQKKSEQLDILNRERRTEQDRILKDAIKQAELLKDSPVLVVSDPTWSHGIIGVVASKLLEKYRKPVYILQEIGVTSKGSARSYGDFHAAEALKYCGDLVIKGGGHKYAAGLSVKTELIDQLRLKLCEYYNQTIMKSQETLLEPIEDAVCALGDLSIELVREIEKMEPFGNGNSRPILRADRLKVVSYKRIGLEGKHAKLLLGDGVCMLDCVEFGSGDSVYEAGDIVTAWYNLDINTWRGESRLQGVVKKLVKIDVEK
jgi:single-stranded-DNA-specific exonuclease